LGDDVPKTASFFHHLPDMNPSIVSRLFDDPALPDDHEDVRERFAISVVALDE